MNIQEMHIRYKLGLDKIDSLQLPDILPEEIDAILNTVIKQFVKTRYGGNNIYKQGFEGNEKRREDLRTLVVTTTLSTIETTSGLSKYTVAFPNNYWFLLREAVSLKGTFCGKDRGITNTNYLYPYTDPTKLEDIEKKLEDPFSKPSRYKVLTTIENNVYTVYTEGLTVANVLLSYLRRPILVDSINIPNVDCDLPDHTHEEIIEMAVNWTLETIESNRFRTQIQKIQTVE